jgi:hypothetical protein
VIAIDTSEVSNTKLLEDKDHEASSQAGEKGKSTQWQEAREEGPAEDSSAEAPVVRSRFWPRAYCEVDAVIEACAVEV